MKTFNIISTPYTSKEIGFDFIETYSKIRKIILFTKPVSKDETP